MGVVENQFRHPKFAMLLALMGLIVGFLAVGGPRDDGLLGVGDVFAADAESTTTQPFDENYDDGVTFTVPDGELGVVIGGPVVTAEAVGTAGTAGATPETVVAPSPSPSTSTSTSTPPTTTEAVGQTAPDGGDVADDLLSTGTTAAEVAAQNSAGIAQVAQGESALAATAFAEAGQLAGSAPGGVAPDSVILGRLGTRDANSVPWALLIMANFIVASGALVFLRLRR